MKLRNYCRWPSSRPARPRTPTSPWSPPPPARHRSSTSAARAPASSKATGCVPIRDRKRDNSLIIDIDGRRFVDSTTRRSPRPSRRSTRIARRAREGGRRHASRRRSTKTAQTKQVAGYNCTVHDVSVSLPFSITGHPGDGMDMNMVMSGRCASSTMRRALPTTRSSTAPRPIPGSSSAIRAPPKSPTGAAQAKAYAELTRKMAEAGMALESHVTISASGNGPMAGMMGKLAASDITTTVTQITVGDLPAEKFDVPAGYKVKTQK